MRNLARPLMTLMSAVMISALPPAVSAGGLIDERGDSNDLKGVVIKSRPAGQVTGSYKLPHWKGVVQASRSSGVRLAVAVVQLMPEISGTNGPNIVIDAPSDLVDLTVTWPKGLSRQDVLQHLVKNFGINIDIDEKSRAIKISRTGELSPVVTPVATQKSSEAVAPETLPVTPAVVAPVVVTPVVATFELKTGKSISSQLSTMAQSAGWRLAWEVEDYQVEQNISLGSDFLKAVTSIIESANADGTHIKATVYQGNKIVRVTAY